MSRFLLSLLLGGSAGAWFYFQLSKRSIARGGRNFAAAALGGLFILIIVYSLSGPLFT